MTELNILASTPCLRPPAPKRRRYLALLLLLAVVGGYVFYEVFLTESEGDRQLRAAIAAADRLDPGWRYEELEAKRIFPPSNDNSAVFVALAANKGRALLNTGRMWNDLQDLTKEFALMAPRASLTEKQTASLRSNLTAMSPALVEARKVANLPRGNVTLDWAPDPISFWLRHVDDCTTVCWLLSMDASLRAQEEDLNGAWMCCEAMLSAARATGDEPLGQLVRVASHRVDALTAMERVLGQGEIPEPVLASTQKNLEEEASHPALLIYLRGHRAYAHYVFSALESDKVSLARFKEKNHLEPGPKEQVQAYFSRHEIKPAHAWLITHWTRAVEIAKRPPQEREQGLANLQKEVAGAPILAKRLLFPRDIFPIFFWGEASLRCAIVVLAAERYRLKHGRWPDALENLVVAQLLSQVPVDPFDNKPLRYRRTIDGVVVYSIGPKGDGDGTAWDRKNLPNDELPPEFRLWNVDQRRQP